MGFFLADAAKRHWTGVVDHHSLHGLPPTVYAPVLSAVRGHAATRTRGRAPLAWISMAHPEGVEPSAFRLEIGRSVLLSYGRSFKILLFLRKLGTSLCRNKNTNLALLADLPCHDPRRSDRGWIRTRGRVPSTIVSIFLWIGPVGTVAHFGISALNPESVLTAQIIHSAACVARSSRTAPPVSSAMHATALFAARTSPHDSSHKAQGAGIPKWSK